MRGRLSKRGSNRALGLTLAAVVVFLYLSIQWAWSLH